MSKPVSTPFPNPETLLAGAQYGDCFRLIVDGQALDAASAARRAFGRAPLWVGRLLRLRNLMVSPFRLKASHAVAMPSDSIVGPFSIFGQSADSIVLGGDDRHLDFRLLVKVLDLGSGHQEISAATAVRTHNRFGRVYLAIVKPFHRIIVPTMLAQIAVR